MHFRDRLFLAVAENLSFSKAAKECFISQPAVTKHIKALENSLNITLFERKGNTIKLTKAGTLTYTHLKKISLQYQALEYEVGRLNDAYLGQLHIGASSTIAQYIVPEVMAHFHKKFPQIKLKLRNGNTQEMEQTLLKGSIDFALVENASSKPELSYKTFMEDQLHVVASTQSTISEIPHINIQEITEIPFVLRERGSGTLQVIENSLAQKTSLFKTLKRSSIWVVPNLLKIFYIALMA